MKCPFCDTELRGTLTTLSCQNERCESSCWPMDSRIWQALIDGKKAQEALKVANESLDIIIDLYRNPRRTDCHRTLINDMYDRAFFAKKHIQEITEPKEE